jgi:hypothetical protein
LDNKDKLGKIANYLLERESLSSNEIDDIIKGIELKPITNSNHDNPVDDTDTDSEKVTGEAETTAGSDAKNETKN